MDSQVEMRTRNLKVDIISACNDSQKGNIMAEKEMRNFALRDENDNEIGVFTKKSPRQAGPPHSFHGHSAGGLADFLLARYYNNNRTSSQYLWS